MKHGVVMKRYWSDQGNRERQAQVAREWMPWLRATGPQTQAGKAKMRRNAIRNGACVAVRHIPPEKIAEALVELMYKIEAANAVVYYGKHHCMSGLSLKAMARRLGQLARRQVRLVPGDRLGLAMRARCQKWLRSQKALGKQGEQSVLQAEERARQGAEERAVELLEECRRLIGEMD